MLEALVGLSRGRDHQGELRERATALFEREYAGDRLLDRWSELLVGVGERA